MVKDLYSFELMSKKNSKVAVILNLKWAANDILCEGTV